MTYGHGGYLGLVRLEDSSIDIAAALDPKFVRSTGSIYQCAADLLDSSNWPYLYDLTSLQWRGTTALTKKRRAIAGHRVFVIGDAASYVEPFTGEGIAWALASAQAVAPLAVQAVRNWNPSYISLWEQIYNRRIQRQQLFGKLTRFALHRPMLT
jgi:flavin-dependent dehydrogenase